MVRDVDGAVASGLDLLCAAPTGIGKTAAALVPAVGRARRERRRVFFVTAKNSQQALALATLRLVIEPGDGRPAVQIVAKDRSCPLDGRRCSEHRCRYQERLPERLARSGVLDELEARGVVDGETIRLRALERRLCPFETSLALAERALVVVSDLNYVFDPRVYLRRFFDKPYDRDVLIVDEAHNLPDRAVGYYSPELDLRELESLAHACLAQGGEPYAGIGLLLGEVRAHCVDLALRLAEERGVDPPWIEPPDRDALERFEGPLLDGLSAYTSFLGAGGVRPAAFAPTARAGDARPRDPLVAALYALCDFCRLSSGDPDLFAALWSPTRAKLLCLDPAPFLRERLRGFHAAVFMSATLAPLDFHRHRLGADRPDTESLDLPSPFPRENRLLLAVDSVDTRYRQRADDAPEIARMIAETMALRPGNYLAFFPSFAYRDLVISKLPRGAHRLLLQLPGLPAESMLGLLRDNPGDTRLLAGVQGGVFAEGVDYPGDMAIGVFVIGPGLPALSPERELVRSYYDQKLGAGFEYAYVYPGLARAVQAGGRAIRSAEDRAFTILFGRRFSEPLYRGKLPAWWQQELCTVDDPVPAVRSFWARHA